MKKKLLSLFIGFHLICALQAQEATVDSAYTWQDSIRCVVVLIRAGDNKEIHVLDSAAANSPNSSIADLLLENSNVQINSYGSAGGIQSLSIRGFSTSQNQVNWNGLSINSLTLGLFNFAGSSASSFDEVNLIKGSASTEYGSAAVGGVVVLNNHADWDKGVSFTVGGDWGSFHSVMEQYKIGYSSKNFSYKLSYQNEFVKNDFEYQNIKKIGKPLEIQTDGEFWNTNVVQELYYRKGASRFRLIGWASGSKKKNPKLLTDNAPTQQHVADSSIRIVLGYDRQFSKSSLELLYGFIGNRFNYVDGANSLDSKYSIYEQLLTAKINGRFSTFNYKFESKNQYQEVINSKYEGVPNRFLSFNSIGIKEQITNNFTLTNTLGVQLASTKEFLAPIFSMGYHALAHQQKILLKGAISNHFRLPTFNDLYWETGGNPDLLAEKGFNIEQSAKFYLHKESTFFKVEGYYSEIRDWILWTPEGSFWTAKNLKRVACYGLEGELNSAIKLKRLQINLRTSGAYTKNVVLESEVDEDLSVGKQARYVPVFSHFSTVGIAYKKFVLQYSIQYQGLRHTAYDNDEKLALPSYYLSSVKVWRRTTFYKSEAFIKFSIENIFNKSYQSVENYAMPGRAFYLTVLLNTNFKNKSK